MPTKPIDRLLFVQGGACFFCKGHLAKADASVENLVAQTHGGSDNDENCGVCCKTLNSLFGRISLKEKIQIALNQKGDFRCPRSAQPAVVQTLKSEVADPALKPTLKSPLKPALKPILKPALKPAPSEPREAVLEDLRRRGNSRPGKPDRLLNTIKATLVSQGQPPELAQAVLEALVALGCVSIKESKVEYKLPQRLA